MRRSSKHVTVVPEKSREKIKRKQDIHQKSFKTDEEDQVKEPKSP